MLQAVLICLAAPIDEYEVNFNEVNEEIEAFRLLKDSHLVL